MTKLNIVNNSKSKYEICPNKNVETLFEARFSKMMNYSPDVSRHHIYM